MLSIRPQQLQLLTNVAEQQFRSELRQYVQQTYSAYAKIPNPILSRLIDLALERARGYGFTWQSTLGQFVSLMAAVAPNFDLHPLVHSGLTNVGIPVERRIEVLTERLHDGVWDEIIANSSNMGWYLASDAFDFSPAGRIAAALMEAIPKDVVKFAKDGLEQSAKEAILSAKHINWQSEDAQFVFSAASLLYGKGFEERSANHSWTSNIFDRGTAIRTQVVLLRMRIALERQIWV